MIARSQLRHHPAVFAVQRDLRGNFRRQHFRRLTDRAANNRDGRFITGRFDCQEQCHAHVLSLEKKTETTKNTKSHEK